MAPKKSTAGRTKKAAGMAQVSFHFPRISRAKELIKQANISFLTT
jgi:hypothetical protein